MYDGPFVKNIHVTNRSFLPLAPACELAPAGLILTCAKR
jgi:hypothetical protein